MQIGGSKMTNKEFLSIVDFLYPIAEPIIALQHFPKKYIGPVVGQHQPHLGRRSHPSERA